MSRILTLLVFTLAALNCAAQTATDLNEGLRVEKGTTAGSFVLKWYGKPGRTYFIQTSETLMPDEWAYTPVIEVGTNAVIQWAFTSSAGYSFVRLMHTDQSFSGSVASADFDGDGLSNYAELNTHHTNPLVADEDDDGLDDGVEVADGTSATSWDTDGDGYSDTEEKHRGTSATSAASVPALANVDSDSEVRYEYWRAGVEVHAYQGSMEGTFYGTHPDGPYEYMDNSVGSGPGEYEEHFEIARQAALAKLNHRFYGPEVSTAQETYPFGYAYLSSSTTSSASLIFSHQAIRVTATTAVPHERVFRLSLQKCQGSTYPSSLDAYSDAGSVVFRIAANKKLATVEVPPGSGSSLEVRRNTLYIKATAHPLPPVNVPVTVEQSIARTVGIYPDAGMKGVIGDTVPSVNETSVIQHFVTPRKLADPVQHYVELKALGTLAPAFGVIYEWNGEGVIPGSGSDAHKCKVSRSTPGRTMVKIKDKNTGTIQAEMYVWVVWCNTQLTGTIAITHQPAQQGTIVVTPVTGGLQFTHTILPAEIITLDEKPDLRGTKSSNPPGTTHPLFGAALADGANNKWDASRQFRFKHQNPNNLPSAVFGQPAPLITVTSFPTDPVEGNDDYTTDDEVPDLSVVPPDPPNDPYQASSLGILRSTDAPKCVISQGNPNDTFDYHLQLQEFARVNLGDKWYVISGHEPWRFRIQLRKLVHATTNVEYWWPDPQITNPIIIQRNHNDF